MVQPGQAEARTPSVSVVIVNYRTADLTVSSVESALSEPETAEVVVVDSGSGNGDAARLRARFQDDHRVHVVDSAENIGFGRANNLGVQSASEHFVFLLNSDATFRPGCLNALLTRWALLREPGVLAPAIYVGSSDEQQTEVGGRFPTAARFIAQRTKRYSAGESPDWVSGCAMLIERDVFARLGGFDPEIFMYYEDVLLCWEIRKAGLNVYRHAAAGVNHLGSQSPIEGRSGSSTHAYDSQDILLRKMGEPLLMRVALKGVRRVYRTIHA